MSKPITVDIKMAEKGNIISYEYSAEYIDENGNPFRLHDYRYGSYRIGHQDTLTGFHDGIFGMRIGERKKIKTSAGPLGLRFNPGFFDKNEPMFIRPNSIIIFDVKIIDIVNYKQS